MLKFEDYKRQHAERRARRSSSPPTVLTIFSAPNIFASPRAIASIACASFRTGRPSASCRTTIRAVPAAEGIRGQQNAGLFALPANVGLRPGEAVAAGTPGQWRGRRRPVTVAFGLDYKVPDRACPHAGESRSSSRCRSPPGSRPGATPSVNVAILAVLLSVLTLIFVFQATLARSSPRPPAGAQRLSAGRSGLARLDRRRAALDRQCHELCAWRRSSTSTSASISPSR